MSDAQNSTPRFCLPADARIEIDEIKSRDSKSRNLKKKTKPAENITGEDPVLLTAEQNAPTNAIRPKATKKKSTRKIYKSVIDITSDNEDEECAGSRFSPKNPPAAKTCLPTATHASERQKSIDNSSFASTKIQERDPIKSSTKSIKPSTEKASSVAAVKQEPLQRIPSVIPSYNYNDSIDDISLDTMIGTPMTCPKTGKYINTASVMNIRPRSGNQTPQSIIKSLSLEDAAIDPEEKPPPQKTPRQKDAHKGKEKEIDVPRCTLDGTTESVGCSFVVQESRVEQPLSSLLSAAEIAPLFLGKPSSSKYLPPHARSLLQARHNQQHTRGPLASGKHGVHSLKTVHKKALKKQSQNRQQQRTQDESSWFWKKQQQNWQAMHMNMSYAKKSASAMSTSAAAAPPPSPPLQPPHRFTGQSTNYRGAPPQLQPLQSSPSSYLGAGPLAAGLASPSSPLMPRASFKISGPLSKGVASLAKIAASPLTPSRM